MPLDALPDFMRVPANAACNDGPSALLGTPSALAIVHLRDLTLADELGLRCHRSPKPAPKRRVARGRPLWVGDGRRRPVGLLLLRPLAALPRVYEPVGVAFDLYDLAAVHQAVNEGHHPGSVG